jgi:hypothetical protein
MKAVRDLKELTQRWLDELKRERRRQRERECTYIIHRWLNSFFLSLLPGEREKERRDERVFSLYKLHAKMMRKTDICGGGDIIAKDGLLPLSSSKIRKRGTE